MTDDLQLLQRYVDEGAEEAFRELTERHINLVHSTALRIVAGDSHLAQDVAQTVFADLARKASSLARGVVLPGWLYRHTCFTASKAVRTERRHKDRAKEAAAMNALNDTSGPDNAWQLVATLLDDAMNQLGARDRDALVLRFLKQQDLRTVGLALGASEDAAQKRVTRALGKLRALLARRGVALSSAALAAALAGAASQAAPAGLAASISTAALAAPAVAATGFTLTGLKLMSIPNLKLALVSTALAASAATPIVLQHQSIKRLQAENQVLQTQTESIDQLRAENAQLAKLKIDSNELARLQAGESELLRLRAEVTRLRREREDASRLLAENAQLKAALEKAAAVQNKLASKPALSSPEEEAAAAAKKQAIERMNHAKQWMLAILTYADKYDGKIPENLGQVQPLAEGLSPDQFEIVSTGKTTDIAEPSRTVVIREKEAQYGPDGSANKTYGFADGHSEVARASENGTFDDWEKQHPTSNPPQ